MKEIKLVEEKLYTARWHLQKAIESNDYGKILDQAADLIAEAKALSITSEPDRPSQAAPVLVETSSTKNYTIPKIEVVPGVRYKSPGKFRTKSGKNKGVVVHYTVSGRSPKNAQGVVGYLAKEGLGCMVMDENGTIHIPQGFDIDETVAYHAGKSEWKGSTSISMLCAGMEICGWGKDSKVGPYRSSESKANIKKGKYQTYTEAQEKALINYCLWQLDVNPEFSIDWIVGHDEIAPSRKSDPGASLSMTMPELRAKIKLLAGK